MKLKWVKNSRDICEKKQVRQGKAKKFYWDSTFVHRNKISKTWHSITKFIFAKKTREFDPGSG